MPIHKSGAHTCIHTQRETHRDDTCPLTFGNKSGVAKNVFIHKDVQTDRQTERQTDRQIEHENVTLTSGVACIPVDFREKSSLLN
jgi:hypothetical protein